MRPVISESSHSCLNIETPDHTKLANQTADRHTDTTVARAFKIKQNPIERLYNSDMAMGYAITTDLGSKFSKQY